MSRSAWLMPLALLAACSRPAPSEIEIRDAWARATAPGQSTGAIYATLANKGGSADRLVGASTDRARMAMIHGNDSAGGMARMRMLDGLDLPAGGQAALKPGATHIMLEGLTKPLTAGEAFDLKLTFEKGGERQVRVSVIAPGDR